MYENNSLTENKHPPRIKFRGPGRSALGSGRPGPGPRPRTRALVLALGLGPAPSSSRIKFGAQKIPAKRKIVQMAKTPLVTKCFGVNSGGDSFILKEAQSKNPKTKRGLEIDKELRPDWKQNRWPTRFLGWVLGRD